MCRAEFRKAVMKEVRNKLEQYDWSKTGDLKPDELAQMLKDNAQTREPTQEVWPAPCRALGARTPPRVLRLTAPLPPRRSTGCCVTPSWSL